MVVVIHKHLMTIYTINNAQFNVALRPICKALFNPIMLYFSFKKSVYAMVEHFKNLQTIQNNRLWVGVILFNQNQKCIY